MEDLRTWLIHWLPIIQSFAALFSILGALASWRFAAIAKQARAEMTNNLIKNDTMSFIQESLDKLNEFTSQANECDNQYDFLKRNKSSLKSIIDKVVAKIVAIEPYVSKEISDWYRIKQSSLDAANNVTYSNIEQISRWLTIFVAKLEIDVQTRQIQQKPKN